MFTHERVCCLRLSPARAHRRRACWFPGATRAGGRGGDNNGPPSRTRRSAVPSTVGRDAGAHYGPHRGSSGNRNGPRVRHRRHGRGHRYGGNGDPQRGQAAVADPAAATSPRQTARESTAMSDATAVIGIVLFVFFLVGVTVGIIVVIAVPARRAGTAARRAHPVRPPGYAAISRALDTGVPERKLAPIFAAGSQSRGWTARFPGARWRPYCGV